MVDKVYSIKELAVIIPKKPATLRKWCEKGVFPGARIGAGGDWEVTQEGVDHYLGKEANTSLSLTQSKEKKEIAENIEAEIKARKGATLAELGFTAEEFEKEKAELVEGRANLAATLLERTAGIRAELAEVKEGLENDRLNCQEETAKFQPENEELKKKVNELRLELKKKTRLLGGEAEAKRKLTKAYKEEAEQTRIQEEAEAMQMRKSAQEAFDTNNCPHIDDISEGLAVIDQMQKEAKRHGFRGEVFDELLNARWIYIYRASKYDKVEPESEKQVDIDKAYDLTGKNKDRVRNNYAKIVLAFKDATEDVFREVEEIRNSLQVSPFISFFTKGADKPEYYDDMFRYLLLATDRIESIMGFYDGCEDGWREPKKEEIKVATEEKPEVVR